jgi:hypothetical protein
VRTALADLWLSLVFFRKITTGSPCVPAFLHKSHTASSQQQAAFLGSQKMMSRDKFKLY